MRRGVWFLLLVLSALVVSAEDFRVTVLPSEQSILVDEIAEFTIQIEHDLLSDQSFDVFSSDVVWNLRTDQPVLVLPRRQFETTLHVRPLHKVPGLYRISLHFRRAGTNDVVKKDVLVELRSPIPPNVTYTPSIRGTADVPALVDPRDGMKFGIVLENQNSRNLPKVDVKLRSNVINKDFSTSLQPLEKKTLSFQINLDPSTIPQQDVLRVSVLAETEKAYQFDLLPIQYEVVTYGGVRENSSVEKSFLKRDVAVSLKNEGNVDRVHEYNVPMFFMKKWFVSSDREYASIPGALVWAVPITAGEEQDINIKYNYRILFWLFLLALALTIAYYVFRSPIVVAKKARVVETKEGAIRELKVVVEVRNRSQKVVEHVKIMDLVPTIADVFVDERSQMLPPEVVKSDRKGTLVKWAIDMIEPQEQRILVYHVKSKFSILGGVKLPVVAVKFHVDGRVREVTSNAPELTA